MTLSILSADRDQDGQHQDRALPHTPQEGWVRPYRPGPYRVVAAALMLMLASFLLFGALITAMSGDLTGALVILGSAVALIALTLRTLRTGIWVSTRGLRQVRLFRTTTLSWQRIGHVRTSQQPVRVLGLPRTVNGQALVVTRADGRVLPMVLTDHNVDFLGRPSAFDRAADAIEDWANPASRS
ncbi:hypothetical protein AQ490_02320 [Wenjunlia vitaminophila]|uniref:PH domain-containing protein n=1 Tax=Wenjunlia vitaminophila TaxID=76728 RepID=A0A0T6LYH6_WENVI|nr:hypothetical protein [Wenjunlia vitaminophila]KRV51062.1 hypothetical protein AQ490_02320 [Wenjunlia vitaminophila]